MQRDGIVRIFFFPVIVLIFLPVAILIDALLRKFLRIKYKNRITAFILGFSYTTWPTFTALGSYWIIYLVILNPVSVHVWNRRIGNR